MKKKTNYSLYCGGRPGVSHAFIYLWDLFAATLCQTHQASKQASEQASNSPTNQFSKSSTNQPANQQTTNISRMYKTEVFNQICHLRSRRVWWNQWNAHIKVVHRGKSAWIRTQWLCGVSTDSRKLLCGFQNLKYSFIKSAIDSINSGVPSKFFPYRFNRNVEDFCFLLKALKDAKHFSSFKSLQVYQVLQLRWMKNLILFSPEKFHRTYV